MTKPTLAQIEAATKVLADYLGPIQSEVAAIRALTATAEVGEPVPEIKMMPWFGDEINATIERCAQELEAAYAECATLTLLHGAARIRALKDKP